ncbi:RHS repeat-associated core domain-containing protein [Chryseobacterium sp. RLHN22]|uniref:RHS repeat-associated core domain-containing protein n=1 Tax=Chryseobacterium sp. RLHN22 TaxID=3437885 RepID=UPI003D9B7D40
MKIKLFFINLLLCFFAAAQDSFHDTNGNTEVNGSGQLQFTLPIALPPGVKSVAPQINLTYTNGLTNGIAGYGWNLSGISSISRIGKNLEKNNEIIGIKLDYSDNYSFNGQRLILKSGEYGKDGAEYVTEKYSNIKIKSVGAFGINGQLAGPTHFEVTFEDGSQAWYGSYVAGSRVSPGITTPLEYNIVKWKDAQGNYISYGYESTPHSGSNKDAGTVRITSIYWGGNETLNKPHFNSIEFNYIDRDLREQSFVQGLAFTQNRLLENIIVKANGSQFKKYIIDYVKNNTNYQFVNKITEYNSANQPANPIIFENESNATTNQIFNQNSRYDDLTEINYNLVKGDFNGDGKLDVLKRNTMMLNRLDGNGTFVDFFYDGEPLSAGTSLYNNILKQKQSLLTIAYDRSLQKLTLKEYGLENNTSLLYKSTDFTSPLLNNALYGGVFNPNVPSNVDHTYYNNFIVDEETYEGNFNGHGYSQFVIRVKNIRNVRRFVPPREGGPKVTTTKYLYSEEFFYFDTVKNIIRRLDVLDHHAKIMVSDFDGDSKTDILQIVGNELRVYSFDNDNNLSLKFTTTKESLDEILYLGDFNGDGKTDIIAPIADSSPDWRMYISTGIGFKKEYYSNLFLYQPEFLGSPRKNRSIGRIYSSSDLNKDGKSDLTIFETQVWFREEITQLNNPDSSYGFNYLRNEGVDANGKPIFSNAYSLSPKEATSSGDVDSEDINYSMYGEHYTPIFGNFRVAQLNSDFVILHKTKLITWDLGNKLDKISRIKNIKQGGIQTDVQYANFMDNTNIYKPETVNFIDYPYINVPSNTNFTVVSKLTQQGRSQDFRYRDLIAQVHGKGMVGFRQMSRSTFYASGFENTKIWSGSELNPTNEALPIKDWSIRTNDESQIFPNNISITNSQLLSFKDYTYKIDKLLNGTVVTTFTNADKPKIVTAINPHITTSKDFSRNVKTIHTVETYNNLYLPTKSVDNINDGFALVTSELEYFPPNLNPGSNYSIGKPKTKISTIQAYGDIKTSKEEYTYDNNLLKTVKTWNRDNSQYLLESNTYDGFGNVTGKVISNSVDSQQNTTGTEFDAKGRFVTKKIDNLGLETQITYNDWGQVLTQTDFLGNVITNVYDGWGKILSSTSSLSGTTNYVYEKLSGNAGTKVTETAPDGNEKISYTNPLGQNYKSSTKAFENGRYVSVDATYDLLGRKLADSEPYYEGQSPSQWNSISYDDNHFPAKVITTTFNGKQTETSVSGLTTVVKELNGYGRTNSKTADALDNIISTTDKGGIINFTFNAAGEQLTATYGTNVVTTKYDSWGRRSEFNDPSNGKYTYEYNTFGQVVNVISPKGEKQYSYNNLGQLLEQTEVSSDGVSTNKLIGFNYDNFGRPTYKSGISNGKPFSSQIEYDAYGRVKSTVENSNGRVYTQGSIVYDNLSRLKSYIKSLSSSGILTEVTISHEYNSWDGELYQLKDKDKNLVLWELQKTNSKGQMLTGKLGATTINNLYDNNGFLTNTNHSSAIKPGILQVSYSFNAIKNELSNRITGGDLTISENFNYDDNNRLTSWTNPRTGQSSSNVYDQNGRILENDQLGEIKYENNNKIYQPTSIDLNANGSQNYTNDLIQHISYNENNDPIFIDGLNGDVAFEYGLTSMRQKVTYGGNFEPSQEGRFTKYYSADGSFEVTVNNDSGGLEKHILYIGGNPYEANIIYLKSYEEDKGFYKFLHKDYLGSILGISNEEGNKLEQRHFDAWGNLTHLQFADGSIYTDKDEINAVIAEYGGLLLDRGYTSHEHFLEVGIIHMNGRLYDPLLRRFLNADENIQDPYNTQNYNKYGYVMNNPLLFNDPSGEAYGLGESMIIAMAVAVLTSIGTDYYLNRPIDFINMAQSVSLAAISSMVSYGVGEIFRSGAQIAKALGDTGSLFAKAGAHALTQGTLSYMQGGNFWSGALSGAFSSASNDLLYHATQNVGSKNILRSDGFTLFNGAVSGGVGSVIGGGNFWVGAGTGLIVTSFNFLMHKPQSSILKDQMKGKYALDGKPDFSDEGIKKMIDSLPELKRIYEKGGKKAVFKVLPYLIDEKGNKTNEMGVTLGVNVFISESYVLNNWELATTLGHEMIHVYHNVFLTSELRGMIRNSWRGAFVISEVEAYTWEIKMGNIEHGVWGQKKNIEELKTVYKLQYRPKNLF